jgi:hypothetical protein
MRIRKSKHTLSDEKRDSLRKESIERRKKIPLAYQLGFYVGEQIIDTSLPTLSVDSIRTRTVIEVSPDEASKHLELSEKWINKRWSIKASDADKDKETENEWNEYRSYAKILEEKYIPKKLECFFSNLYVDESVMNDFKEGLSASLWNSDCCYYDIAVDKIKVENTDETGYFCKIELTK